MTEEKQNQVEAITFKKTELDAFFPDQTPVEIIKKQNLKILSSWQRREQAREEAKASAPKPVPAPKAAEAQKKKGGDAGLLMPVIPAGTRMRQSSTNANATCQPQS